jgi:hypothetical protein
MDISDLTKKNTATIIKRKPSKEKRKPDHKTVLREQKGTEFLVNSTLVPCRLHHQKGYPKWFPAKFHYSEFETHT